VLVIDTAAQIFRLLRSAITRGAAPGVLEA
jgi:hypothetical protein